MDDQLAAIRNAIKALDEVDKIAVPTSQQAAIAGSLNDFLTQLQKMHEAGSESYFPVPLDALRFLDESADVSNPWLYTQVQVESAISQTTALAAREQFYKEISTEVSAVMREEESAKGAVDKLLP